MLNHSCRYCVIPGRAGYTILLLVTTMLLYFSAYDALGKEDPRESTPAESRAPVFVTGWAARLTGICDASAAVVRGNKALLVASDEYNVLLAFDGFGSLLHEVQPSLNDLLPGVGISMKKTNGGDYREIDIEASTLLFHEGREIVFWIGSHGNNKAKWNKEKGNVREVKPRMNRRLLFATNLPRNGERLGLVGKPVTNLYDVLLNPSSDKLARQLAMLVPARDLWSNAGGWNIEGLATDTEHRLLIGFRSPVDSAKRVLVVRMENPLDAVDGKEPHIDIAEWLDLGLRGIRSMEWSRFHMCWMIVAGPVDHVDVMKASLPQLPELARDFALYGWLGFGHPPVLLQGDLMDLRPEICIPAAGGVYLVSDDGKEKRDGKTSCGDLMKGTEDSRDARVYARAIFVPLPSHVMNMEP
jgi:hypothetical protein